MKQDYRQYQRACREVLLDIDGWSRIERIQDSTTLHRVLHGMPWKMLLRTPMKYMCADTATDPVADVEMGVATFYFSGRYIDGRPLLTTD